jgi:PPOX class probable F420-dependent enzyme
MELTAEQQTFLAEPHFAVVSTIAADGMPHQIVMWFHWTPAGVRLNSPSNSIKIKHLQQDPRISICVEDGYRYITLQGTATLNLDPEQSGKDYAEMGAKYQSTFASRMNARPPKGGYVPSERTSIFVTVTKVLSNGF